MKIRILVSVVLFSLVSYPVVAQFQQYIPFEIRRAYQNGTRSIKGVPGPGYWQNHADYSIDVELLAEESRIRGEEKIIYHNESPDTLKQIVFRLYPDLFRKGNARNWSLGEDAVNEGVILDSLRIDGNLIDLENRKSVYRSATNLYVGLSEPMQPGDSLIVEVKWQFEVPTRTVRMGNYGNNRFFIAYWYPQIAVYDDIDGWDRIEYHGTVEYYNDFNNYDVSVTVPEGFLVWATGDLVNEEDIFQQKILEKLEKARKSDEIVSIVTAGDSRKGKVLNKPGKNTWNFTATEVPDFSFAAADEMNWEGSSVLVDSIAGRRVFTDVVFPDSTRTFHKGAEWNRSTVEYFSYTMPAYPFPYSHMTSFCNGRRGGGMETPMMANDGDPQKDGSALGLILHENAHTYFPFFMGINERKYAWMDEGWAVFLPIDLMEDAMPDFGYLENMMNSYETISGKEKEATLMMLSYQLAGSSGYRYHAYSRSAVAYYFLRDALGDSLFNVALTGFIDRWNGKHPTPYDFFNSFTDLAGKKLFWFFHPWFFEKAYADQGIKKVTMDNKIVVENVGGLPLPIFLNCEYADGSSETLSENTAIWEFGDQAVVLQADPDKKIQRIALGSELIPDVNQKNNLIEPVYE